MKKKNKHVNLPKKKKKTVEIEKPTMVCKPRCKRIQHHVLRTQLTLLLYHIANLYSNFIFMNEYSMMNENVSLCEMYNVRYNTIPGAAKKLKVTHICKTFVTKHTTKHMIRSYNVTLDVFIYKAES